MVTLIGSSENHLQNEICYIYFCLIHSCGNCHELGIGVVQITLRSVLRGQDHITAFLPCVGCWQCDQMVK